MLIYPTAKINIGLNITEKRPDGYHNIETVFYPIPLQDGIEITSIRSTESKERYQLKVSGAVLDGTPDDNLVIKAFKILQSEYDLPPLRFNVFKHIPTGAGLGGGSADAAFTLKAVNERFSLNISDDKLEEYAAQIGADCPFFIKNKPVFAQGIGNEFSPINLSLKGKYLILVKPEIFVSTREAYSLVTPSRPKHTLPELLAAPINEWKYTIVNDFEKSVFARYTEIAAIKDKLYDLGADYASMSGSGSSVFGIFDSEIENVDEIFSGYFVRQRELS